MARTYAPLTALATTAALAFGALTAVAIVQKRQPDPAPMVAAAKTVYLTFDDGPDPTWTPQVLAVLAKYQVRATFFVLGRNAEARPG